MITDVDRRSLAYRLDMVLRTCPRPVCVRGGTGSDAEYLMIAAMLALEGIRFSGHETDLTVEQLLDVAAGKSEDISTDNLVALAAGNHIPPWVLTDTPPPGKRVAMAKRPDGWHATYITNDDSSEMLGPQGRRDFIAWLKTFPALPETATTAAATPSTRPSTPPTPTPLSTPPHRARQPRRWWRRRPY